jgi:predicted Ser/Thr protein kinase
MSSCLPDDDVLALVEGRLVGPEAARAIDHLDECETCRKVVAAASPTAPSAPTDPDTPAQAPLDSGLEVGARIGRFVVVGPVGKGGMGEVYAAFDPDLSRKVALKIVRTDLRGDNLQERLLREAQALARLSHAEVITIYEVGTIDDRVFIAMEFMDGGTLRDWSRAAARPWHETVDRFVRAGLGLAAAHDAGLVHRDFKPDNVLLALDGRQRVTDFGLARAVVSDTDREGPEGNASRIESPLDVTLTSAGAVIGTPAYMAPEQLRQQADPRSDQFSFCASLYQAVYGVLPFASADLGEYVEAVKAHRVRPAPRGTRVPQKLRVALLRGLAFDPDARFATMKELLDAVRATRRRRRLPWLIAAAVALLAVGAATQAWVGRARPACTGAARHLDGVWDAARKRDVHDAFLATRAPFAAGSWAGTAATLDEWTESWALRRTDACEDTQVRDEEPAPVMELRYACLDDRLEAARALIDRFAHADAHVVEQAPGAAANLPSLAACDDVHSLTRRVPYRDDAQARAAKAIDTELGRAVAAWLVGQRDPMLATVQALVARARDVGYAPTLSTTCYQLAAMQVELGHAPEALGLLHEATIAAVSGRDDVDAELAWGRLAAVSAESTHQLDEAQLWLRYAEAQEANRGAAPDETTADLWFNEFRVAIARGDLSRGEQLARRRVALEEKLPHRDQPLRDALGNLAVVLSLEGHLDESYPLFARILADNQARLGATHPETVTAREDTAYALILLHRDGEALPLLEEATRERTQLAGARSYDVATDQSRTAQALAGLGRPDDADALARQALATLEDIYGHDEPALFDIVEHVGEIALLRGRAVEAVAVLERSYAMAVRGQISPSELAPVEFSLARTLVAAGGDRGRATALATKAHDTYAEQARRWGGANVASADEVARWLAANR